MENKNRFSEKEYSKYNNAIIVVGGEFADKEYVSDTMNNEWLVMRSSNEYIIRKNMQVVDPKRKPNIIIMDWVKDGIGFINATFWLTEMQGYKIENVNLVWKKEGQDDLRRKDPDAEVRESYTRIDKLFRDITIGTIKLSEKMDGEVWIVGDVDDIKIKDKGEPILNTINDVDQLLL